MDHVMATIYFLKVSRAHLGVADPSVDLSILLEREWYEESIIESQDPMKHLPRSSNATDCDRFEIFNVRFPSTVSPSSSPAF